MKQWQVTARTPATVGNVDVGRAVRVEMSSMWSGGQSCNSSDWPNTPGKRPAFSSISIKVHPCDPARRRYEKPRVPFDSLIGQKSHPHCFQRKKDEGFRNVYEVFFRGEKAPSVSFLLARAPHMPQPRCWSGPRTLCVGLLVDWLQ